MYAEELSALEHPRQRSGRRPGAAVVGLGEAAGTGGGSGPAPHRPRAAEAGWGDPWAEGRRIPRGELEWLVAALTPRDRALLGLLGEHRYLTQEDAEALLFPRLRRAQRRLLRLRPPIAKRSRQGELVRVRNARGLGLLMAGSRHTPGPWRRLPAVYALRQKGALVLAELQAMDAGATKELVKRSYNAMRFTAQLEHDLAAIAFFAGLARSARELPDQGLDHWTGEGLMRRRYRERGADLAPDGWGRYLTDGREVTFQLEWDTGTEPAATLTTKARGYGSFAEGVAGGEVNHVLWVAEREPRERRLREALERARPDARYVQHWTSSAELLTEQGHLGPLWRHLEGGERRTLPQLPGRLSGGRAVEACLGKPDWWQQRPVGGIS